MQEARKKKKNRCEYTRIHARARAETAAEACRAQRDDLAAARLKRHRYTSLMVTFAFTFFFFPFPFIFFFLRRDSQTTGRDLRAAKSRK